MYVPHGVRRNCTAFSIPTFSTPTFTNSGTRVRTLSSCIHAYIVCDVAAHPCIHGPRVSTMLRVRRRMLCCLHRSSVVQQRDLMCQALAEVVGTGLKLPEGYVLGAQSMGSFSLKGVQVRQQRGWVDMSVHV